MRAGAFFRGLWRGLDGLRRVLHLLLLLAIFGFLVGLLRVAAPRIPARGALLIAPNGSLVEQLSGDPVQRALQQARGAGHSETLLWDLTESIRAATGDARIRAIALDLDDFEGGTQPTLAELAAALGKFRAGGKKIIAYGTELTQERYYLAAQADEIYLDPLGFVLLQGYDRYPTYIKGALDKLGVDVNVFRVGTFKSAVEPYTRNDMSPEDREASRQFLGSLWGSYQQALTRARRLPPQTIGDYAATLAARVPASGGDAAKVALQSGLVTAIKTRLEFEQRVAELAGKDEENGSFAAVTVADYLRYARVARTQSAVGKPRVGVIMASGTILDGEQPPGTIGGDSVSRLVRQARMDRDIKAVVLRVDSPGGSVLASEQIYRELQALRAAGKPLVVSMSGYAASGGYYIAAPADEIWAHPATVTGSIGIFAIIPTVDRTFGKVGLNVDGVGTTPLAGQLQVGRPLGAQAKALLQSQVDRGYEEFLARVGKGRGKTRDEVDRVAQGHVWSGIDAQQRGLVDHLGNFDDALRAAAQRAHLRDFAPYLIEPQLTWPQELALQLKSRAARLLLQASPDQRALAQLQERLDPALRLARTLATFNVPQRLYAYCFCEVR